MPPSTKPPTPPGYWPCACVKYGRRLADGVGDPATLKIKMNPPVVYRCRACKATRPNS